MPRAAAPCLQRRPDAVARARPLAGEPVGRHQDVVRGRARPGDVPARRRRPPHRGHGAPHRRRRDGPPAGVAGGRGSSPGTAERPACWGPGGALLVEAVVEKSGGVVKWGTTATPHRIAPGATPHPNGSASSPRWGRGAGRWWPRLPWGRAGRSSTAPPPRTRGSPAGVSRGGADAGGGRPSGRRRRSRRAAGGAPPHRLPRRRPRRQRGPAPGWGAPRGCTCTSPKTSDTPTAGRTVLEVACLDGPRLRTAR